MRDNWCIGFSREYTVGVWVGNFSGEAMWNVSGVSGAAPIWLEIVKYLHKAGASRSPSAPRQVVLKAPRSGLDEPSGREWFIQGTEPGMTQYVKVWPHPRITYPPPGTLIALDPDIPQPHQRIFFQASRSHNEVKWLVDGELVGESVMQPWIPVRGHHRLSLIGPDGQTFDTVSFTVRD
jgi:penicillin-binding protein 1C